MIAPRPAGKRATARKNGRPTRQSFPSAGGQPSLMGLKSHRGRRIPTGAHAADAQVPPVGLAVAKLSGSIYFDSRCPPRHLEARNLSLGGWGCDCRAPDDCSSP